MPAGVEFANDQGVVTVKGPKGELTQRLPREMIVALDDATTCTFSRSSVSVSARRTAGSSSTIRRGREEAG